MDKDLENRIKEENAKEDALFEKSIEKYLNDSKNGIERRKSIEIGNTPLSLQICGANDLRVTITQKVLNKVQTEHFLNINMIEQILKELRTPAILLNGSQDNPHSIVAVTSIKDTNNDPIIIAVSLDRMDERLQINRISSVYGKETFAPYIDDNGESRNGYLRNAVKFNDIIAIDNEKAELMFQSVGLQLPEEGTYISFNNSISHSLDSVKGLDEKIYNKILDNLHNKYPAPTGRENKEENMEDVKVPKLADINEAVGEYKAVEIQEDIAKQMLDLIKDMPPMTKEQHQTLANTCQDFLDNSHKIRAEFTALQGENEKLHSELAATKAELAEARKELAIYKEAMAQGITIDGSKDIDQYAYLVTEVLPDNIANIEQKLAENARTESAIRESDYNFKDLVALIYSSKAYTEQTLPLEFVAKLEQSIEKLGYVSGETYGKVQTELEGVKTELAGAKNQIAELTEINETLQEDNRQLNCRVLELVSINENVNHIQQNEMTGLSPIIQKLTELNEKPDMKDLPGMLEKIKNIIGINDKQRTEKGGDER